MTEKLEKEELLAKLEMHSAVYPEEVSSASLIEAGLWDSVALLPKSFEERLQYLGNMLVQMCFNRKSADPKLKMELTSITTALSYLLNSSSFFGDEYKDFDRAEIDRKLGRRHEGNES